MDGVFSNFCWVCFVIHWHTDKISIAGGSMDHLVFVHMLFCICICLHTWEISIAGGSMDQLDLISDYWSIQRLRCKTFLIKAGKHYVARLLSSVLWHLASWQQETIFIKKTRCMQIAKTIPASYFLGDSMLDWFRTSEQEKSMYGYIWPKENNPCIILFRCFYGQLIQN